ncbi:MAG: NosD domain-containing protein [Candidatus Thorarchaeota archaeon]
MKRGVVLGTILVLSVLILSAVPASDSWSGSRALEDTSSSIHVADTYVEHGPILIQSDADFESQGWPGNGTEVIPYRINGLNITAQTTCINITGTTAYFMISNCLLTSISEDESTGIFLGNMSNGVAEDCLIVGKEMGISLAELRSSRIENNTISDASIGISGWSFAGCLVKLNEVYNCTWGMQLWDANDTSVCYNTIYEYSRYGILASGGGSNNSISHNEIHSSYGEFVEAAINLGSSAWVFEDNSVHDNYEGVEIWFSGWGPGRMMIRNNSFVRNRFAFDILWGINITIQDNTIADSITGVVLYDSENCEVLDNVFSNMTSRAIGLMNSRNCTVRGNTMDASGIRIDGATLSMWRHDISENTVSGKTIGYFLDSEDIEIDGSQYSQVFLVDCTSVTVEGGDFHDVSTGVSIAFSDSCEVRNIEAHDTLFGGIRLLRSDDCIIEGNRIHNNSYRYGRDGGINLQWVINCTIRSNHIYWNYGSGIQTWYGAAAVNCTIVNNAIYNNTDYGVALFDGYGNMIYGNALGWNEEENAWDHGADNVWDDGISVGNWWSDYEGEGVYNITGDAESVDRFPNVLPRGIPTLPLDQTTATLPFDPLIVIAVGGGIVLILVIFGLKKRR